MLVQVPRQFIEQYSVQLDRRDSHHISGWLRMMPDPTESQKATIRIPELKLSAEATAGKDGLLRFSLDAPNLELWSLEKPKLYRVEITMGADRVSEEIGFRTIETRGTDILLNGKSISLRGSICTKSLSVLQAARMAKEARTLLGWARELGCNFVRLCGRSSNW